MRHGGAGWCARMPAALASTAVGGAMRALAAASPAFHALCPRHSSSTCQAGTAGEGDAVGACEPSPAAAAAAAAGDEDGDGDGLPKKMAGPSLSKRDDTAAKSAGSSLCTACTARTAGLGASCPMPWPALPGLPRHPPPATCWPCAVLVLCMSMLRRMRQCKGTLSAGRLRGDPWVTCDLSPHAPPCYSMASDAAAHAACSWSRADFAAV